MVTKAMDVVKDEKEEYSKLRPEHRIIFAYWKIPAGIPDVEKKTELKKLYSDLWSLMNEACQTDMSTAWQSIKENCDALERMWWRLQARGKSDDWEPAHYHDQRKYLGEDKQWYVELFLKEVGCCLIHTANHYGLTVEDIAEHVWEEPSPPPKVGYQSITEPNRRKTWDKAVAKHINGKRPGGVPEAEAHGIWNIPSFWLCVAEFDTEEDPEGTWERPKDKRARR